MFTYNITAAALAAIFLPWTLRVLHVAGDQYGVGLALLLVAVGLDRRIGHWITRFLLYATALGCVVDHRVLMQSLGYFMGATS